MTTKSEAKVLETDVVIFPLKLGQNEQETVLTQDQEKTQIIEANPHEIDNESRFAQRLFYESAF